MKIQIVLSGIGGQGLISTGEIMGQAASIFEENMYATMTASYGSETRGTFTKTDVIISDEPVGSPIVDHPDVLMVMNRPSLDKYESAVQPGGMIFVDSTLIDRRVERTDVTTFYVPATAMASESGITTLANMILTGKILKELGQFDMADVENALRKVVSAKHPEMYEVNLKALTMGRDYE